MKTLEFKLEDKLLLETERVMTLIKKPRNKYISEALNHYNKIQKQKLLSKKLSIESKLVGQESMKVLSEFEQFADEN